MHFTFGTLLSQIFFFFLADSSTKKASKSRSHAIVVAISAAFAVIIFTVILVYWKGYKKGAQLPKTYSRKMDHLHCYFDSCTFLTSKGSSEILDILFSFSLFFKITGVDHCSFTCWRLSAFLPLTWFLNNFFAESGESILSSFNSNKAIVFPYYEVRDATSNFSMSLKIGQGSYGSVYLGKLKGTVS